ncbi:hypothetical protein [Streptomyces sp. NPDC047841]|uniref:hypothetical protein n=1 Tax=Streptomyces sp. NPDC047841 TaxID=3154708 RepID=UPI00345321C4
MAARRAGDTETTEERAARASTRSAATVARDRLGLLVLDDLALLDAAETAWRTAVELPDISLGPVVDGRFEPDVEAALEVARERSRSAHTALRIAGAAYVNNGH